MTDIKLLPLPEADGFMETFDTYGCPVGSEDAWGEETVKETIRANVAHATAAKDAEIERLAEALRMIAKQGPHYGPDGTYKTWRHWADIARAALDQEVGNG